MVGALAASAVILAVLAWRGQLDWVIVCAAALTVAAVAIRSNRTRRTLATEARLPGAIVGTTSLAIHPDPVILVDRRSVVLQANEAAHAVLPGLRERQPLAFALRAPDVLDAIPTVAASGDPEAVEFGGRVATEPTWEVRLRRLDESGPGSEPCVALFFRDLTSQRRSDTMRVDFVANVSHELRTPLASLLGFIETLQGPAKADAAARERFLEIMRLQANRMKRLIDDLLQLSRVELKAHVPPSTPLDLAGALRHMIEIMAPLAADRGVSVSVDAPDELSVLGDRDELLRVVENLVENAIKYGGRGGRVEVTLSRTGEEGASDRVELHVRDYGPGIAPEHLPRLTERFYRVDVADSRAQGGTGLGLAIVKHIVGRHRGRLTVDSEPGGGASFRVMLPAAPDTRGQAGAPTAGSVT
jgi:two-component system phosphate regulon sensor histidine kinase PhoR